MNLRGPTSPNYEAVEHKAPDAFVLELFLSSGSGHMLSGPTVYRAGQVGIAGAIAPVMRVYMEYSVFIFELVADWRWPTHVRPEIGERHVR